MSKENPKERRESNHHFVSGIEDYVKRAVQDLGHSDPRFKRSANLELQKVSMDCVVKLFADQNYVKGVVRDLGHSDLTFQSPVIHVLQEACVARVVKLFKEALVFTLCADRDDITINDFRLAARDVFEDPNYGALRNSSIKSDHCSQ